MPCANMMSVWPRRTGAMGVTSGIQRLLIVRSHACARVRIAATLASAGRQVQDATHGRTACTFLLREKLIPAASAPASEVRHPLEQALARTSEAKGVLASL